MLTVISPNEMAMTKAAQRRLWSEFTTNGTYHSKLACTLPYIIRRCELEKIDYTLQASPGAGYFIKKGVTLS